MYKLIILLIVLLLIIYMIYDVLHNPYKTYYDYFAPYPNPSISPIENNYISYPIWNLSSRSTRNMSYDLRGDVPIPYFVNMPFNMSERMPIQNKTLSDIADNYLHGIDGLVTADLYQIVKIRTEMCALAFATQEILKNQQKVDKILANEFDRNRT